MGWMSFPRCVCWHSQVGQSTVLYESTCSWHIMHIKKVSRLALVSLEYTPFSKSSSKVSTGVSLILPVISVNPVGQADNPKESSLYWNCSLLYGDFLCCCQMGRERWAPCKHTAIRKSGVRSASVDLGAVEAAVPFSWHLCSGTLG